jgi:YD repeat-containing protein
MDGITTRVQTLPRGQPLRWQRGLAAVDVELDALQRPILIHMPDGEVRRLGYMQGFAPIAQTSSAGWARWESASPMVQQALSLQQYVEQVAAQTTVDRPGPGGTDTIKPDAARALEPPPPQAWPGLQWVRDDFGRYVGGYTRVTGWDVRRYDADNRIVERDLSDGTVWRWQRDALGRILRHSVERPGSTTLVTTLDYDGARLKAIHHPNESESFAYDRWGRVRAHTVTRPFSPASEVLERTAPATAQRGSWSYTERFDYDAADRVIADHLPEGGELRYRWGPGDQLQTITYVSARAVPLLARWFGWGEQTVIRPLDKAGRPGRSAGQQAARGYAWGNGIELEWSVNGQGRLSHIDYLPPAPQK